MDRKRKGYGTLKKTCNECQSIFLARHDRPGLYCSMSCASKNKPKKKTRVILKCRECNVEYEVKRHRVETSRYCSHDCRRKNMPSKEAHAGWKGGISRTWKSKTLIKQMIAEKGCCETCGALNDLQGHHIVHYAENTELRDDASNLKILCILCHAEQHPEIKNFILRGKIYG